MLVDSVVLAAKANEPTDVLLPPVVLACKADLPTAVLESPVVIAVQSLVTNDSIVVTTRHNAITCVNTSYKVTCA